MKGLSPTTTTNPENPLQHNQREIPYRSRETRELAREKHWRAYSQQQQLLGVELSPSPSDILHRQRLRHQQQQ
ncbi:13523_t:CDS:2 [Entrophospora sp. SA101]|nr:13523_t:CDS:2 [Entrophospora sp. SA101]